MSACATCGTENPEGARFCLACGASLATARPREVRKLVTVLFCDVSGSTELGERLDAESVREIMLGYFAGARAAIELHGGTLEKFAGDAVMAVFGVPVAHEDDALRACRAALELRERLAALNEELLPRFGSRLAVCIGINSGEVVAGDPSRGEAFVAGDAVNVAARLEEHAAPGEVLVGELAARLSGAQVERVEPFEARGKAEPVRAFRLLGLAAETRRPGTGRFVGRSSELAVLQERWNRALSGRRCTAITVVGMPGIGKSHLVERFVAGLSVPVLRGRCLPYGEGITYWPVVEVVKQLDVRPSDPDAARVLGSLLGEDDAPVTREEIGWAFRSLLSECAPLAVVLDDLQWGESTFLDLVASLPSRATDGPILLLGLARPELLARRPDWAGVFRLEPLSDEEVEELVAERVTGELRERVLRAAGGNPLFVEEMIAMLAVGGGDVSVPPTLQALLEARLDQLEAAERRAIEVAAVEGEVFHGSAVAALTPEEPDTAGRLAALVRGELIREAPPQIPGQEAYRFRHVLVRDAAYGMLTRADRALLHERFADWLELRAAGLVELDEIAGYHLEQAALSLRGLARPHSELARRGGERLAAAGRRALWRGDERASASLLERALVLNRPFRVDVNLELDLARALWGEPRRAAAVAAAAAERAAEDGDAAAETLARGLTLHHRAQYETDRTPEELEGLLRTAIPLLEADGDHAGLAHAWFGLAFGVANFLCRFGDYAHAAEQALRHARLAGERWADSAFLSYALAYGPLPADEALRELDRLLPDPRPRDLAPRAWLLAMLDRIDEAWPLALEARRRDLDATGYPWGNHVVAEIAILAGDYETAIAHLRELCESLEESEGFGFLSSFAPMLGRELCRVGRHDEAEPLAQRGRELERKGDPIAQAPWRQAQALVEARRGRHAAAELLAREAVELIHRSDGLNFQGNALCDLAEVLEVAGRTAEAQAVLAEALDRFERKRNLPLARRTRERLAALEAAPA